MKARLILLFIIVVSFTECSSIKKEQSFKQDQYDVLNDFLETRIKDINEEIIIIKEKKSLDEAIKIFRGDFLEFADSDSLVRLEKTIKEGGINFPLYDETNWRKMKKKYGSTKENPKYNFGDWNENDFRHKKIEFVNGIEFWKKLKSIYLSAEYDKRDKSIRKVYAFSTPMLYKKDYLTFLVFEGNNDFSPISSGEEYVVVMEKIKGNWMVMQKGYDNVYH